jgi:hypothetical protein
MAGIGWIPREGLGPVQAVPPPLPPSAGFALHDRAGMEGQAPPPSAQWPPQHQLPPQAFMGGACACVRACVSQISRIHRAQPLMSINAITICPRINQSSTTSPFSSFLLPSLPRRPARFWRVQQAAGPGWTRAHGQQGPPRHGGVQPLPAAGAAAAHGPLALRRHAQGPPPHAARLGPPRPPRLCQLLGTPAGACRV